MREASALVPNRLIWLNLALVAAVWLHDLDHVRQLREVEGGVAVLGLLGMVATLASLAVSIARHPLAPVAAVVVGFGTAIGFLAVHLVPDWGPLSDGYPEATVDGLSWAIAVIPMLVATAVGFAGVASMRLGRGTDLPQPSTTAASPGGASTPA